MAKRGRSGKLFYGCSNYPTCKRAYWYKPVDRKCPECGSLLLERNSKMLNLFAQMINVGIKNSRLGGTKMVEFHATTICAVRRGPDDICIGGDGQVTMGETAIMKNGAKKVRKIYKNSVISGFAGSCSRRFCPDLKNLKESWKNTPEISNAQR